MKTLILTVILFLISLVALAQDALVNKGNFKMHTGSKIGIFGDFKNDGVFIGNTGEFHLVGSSLQTINGANTIEVEDLYVNNTNHVKLDNELKVTDVMTFTAGEIRSDRGDKATEFVHFLNGSSHTGASSSSFINGVARKTGNTAFNFPIGENGLYRSVGISAPTSVNHHFTAHYTNSDPHTNGYNHGAKDPIIDHISNCEYWMLDRTNGASNVSVTLSYDNTGTAGCSGVVNQSELLVARWDGSKWANHGKSSTSGTAGNGTVTSLGVVTAFSPFTLAATTPTNPLPVELLAFNAVKKSEKSVFIYWSTASEINSDFFIVQKTKDFEEWVNVSTVEAQGNSVNEVTYETFDNSPYSGDSYYRLKQVDFNGNFEYSNVEKVNFESLDYSIYPNPTKDVINISLTNSENYKLQLLNAVGQVININNLTSTTSNAISVNVKSLPKGIYYLEISDKNEDKLKTAKIIIQ